MQNLDRFIKTLRRQGYSEEEAWIIVMRLQLIKIIKLEISKRKWSQRQAAKILGVSQPRIAEIFAHATEKFSVETLTKYLLRLNLKTSLNVEPASNYD